MNRHSGFFDNSDLIEYAWKKFTEMIVSKIKQRETKESNHGSDSKTATENNTVSLCRSEED